MDGKRIRCLQIVSQHVPIHLQQFPSYSNRKCQKSPFSRTAAHIFVSPGDAPATISTRFMTVLEHFCDSLNSRSFPELTRSLQFLVSTGFSGNHWQRLTNLWANGLPTGRAQERESSPVKDNKKIHLHQFFCSYTVHLRALIVIHHSVWYFRVVIAWLLRESWPA